MSFGRRIAGWACASALLAALVLTATTDRVTAATPDPLGQELMRLTNLDRSALGRPALLVDPTLVGFAHDTAWTCPGTTMVIAGRSIDMARRDYLSHSIKSCRKSDGTTYGSLDVMKVTFHYASARGENLAWNWGYSTSDTVRYASGCPVGSSGTAPASGCTGPTTTTVTSVAFAQRGFMNSQGHRDNLLGGFDRFGCASGIGSDGGVYYTCLFSLGAPAVAVTDAVLPRVTSESGKGGVYRRGRGRTFYATMSDNVALRSGAVYFDGVKVKSWTWNGSTRAARVSLYVSARRMRYGYHTIVWRARDLAWNRSTTADGRVRFRAY